MTQQFHSQGMKTYVHTKTWTGVFIAALFIKAKEFKQSECPSTDEHKIYRNLLIDYCEILIQRNSSQQ